MQISTGRMARGPMVATRAMCRIPSPACAGGVSGRPVPAVAGGAFLHTRRPYRLGVCAPAPCAACAALGGNALRLADTVRRSHSYGSKEPDKGGQNRGQVKIVPEWEGVPDQRL